MRFRPYIFVFSGTVFILALFVLLVGYVFVKHTVNPEPHSSFADSYIDVKNYDSKQGPKSFFHYKFNELQDCRAVLKQPVERTSEKIDTFMSTGTIVRIDLSALYAGAANARFVDVDASCLKTNKDCRLSVFIEKENADGQAHGCADAQSKCLLELTCERKSFWGMDIEKKSYRLVSEGRIEALN